MVVGQANKDNSSALFIVGNGGYSGTTVSKRSNALEVLNDGRVTIGAGPTNDMDVATKKYVDDKHLFVHAICLSNSAQDSNVYFTLINTYNLSYTNISKLKTDLCSG